LEGQTDGPNPPHQRQRFTPFGAIVFVLSILLLVSKLTGWITGAEDIDQKLCDGLRQVDAFAFAGNYVRDVQQVIASSVEPGTANAGVLIPALFVAFPSAIADSLSGGGWAVLGFLMALTLGTFVLWDSVRNDSYLWIAAIPFVGGLAAWVLSFVVLQFLLLAFLFVLQALALIGGVMGIVPKLSDTLADALDKFHLTKSVASDASRVFGKGHVAEALEKLERHR
jgi:hypothetical protein